MGRWPDREVVRVVDKWEEGRDISSMKVVSEREAWGEFTPGQFALLWIPKVDEIPLSPADVKEREQGWEILFTVKVVGEATKVLSDLGIGAPLGLKGPLGRGYELDYRGKVVGVGGGSGAPSVLSALFKAEREGGRGVLLLGAKTVEELPYRDWVGELGVDVRYSTDDGTLGKKGFVTALLEEMLEKELEGDEQFVVCGPEVMMVAVRDMALKRGLNVQFSLERYIKCGIGICDACTISGYRVCRDGPVFPLSTILKMEEFGKVKRGPSGKRELL
ncbi:MAG: dihydroorotate dehydrogenase electron transfer subunit [Thermoplasmata archaeon]|nr:dihydroorotate dehydrogenase electron transfer subunit [Thermoplasmata archaeon]